MSGDADTALDPIHFCHRCGARLEQTGVHELQTRVEQGDKIVCPACAPQQAKRPGGSGFVVAPSARLSRGFDPDAPPMRRTPLLHILAGIGVATATALAVILIWFIVRAAIHGEQAKASRNPPSTATHERP